MMSSSSPLELTQPILTILRGVAALVHSLFWRDHPSGMTKTRSDISDNVAAHDHEGTDMRSANEIADAKSSLRACVLKPVLAYSECDTGSSLKLVSRSRSIGIPLSANID